MKYINIDTIPYYKYLHCSAVLLVPAKDTPAPFENVTVQ